MPSLELIMIMGRQVVSLGGCIQTSFGTRSASSTIGTKDEAVRHDSQTFNAEVTNAWSFTSTGS